MHASETVSAWCNNAASIVRKEVSEEEVPAVRGRDGNVGKVGLGPTAHAKMGGGRPGSPVHAERKGAGMCGMWKQVATVTHHGLCLTTLSSPPSHPA